MDTQAAWNPAYFAFGVAILVGSLIAVPWRASGAPTSLLIVPLVAAYWHFGAAIAPLLAIAGVIANATRKASPLSILTAVLVDLTAFAVAVLVASAAETPGSRAAAFAIVFTLARVGFWSLVEQAIFPSVDLPIDRRVDQPDLGLSLIVAPLGAVAVVAGELLGEGGALLALAAVLPVLSIVGEWWRLRVARAEAELERDQLAQARIIQEELTYLITHEVRNPLTTILGYCQLARRSLPPSEESPDDLNKHLDRIYRAGKTIERLTENLLQLSKVDSIESEAGNETVDLRNVVRDVAAEIEPLAEQKRQTVVLELPEPPPVAWASPILLREALSNLASNAVKYTPEGGRVRIWASAGPEPGCSTLGVSDTGFGLSAMDQGRLFTKFFRSEDPRVARERGAGLGLALTQAIVRRMGGDIVVESRLNEGATFRVLLPTAAHGS